MGTKWLGDARRRVSAVVLVLYLFTARIPKV